MPATVVILTRIEDLRAVRDQWRALTLSAAALAPTIFQGPEFSLNSLTTLPPSGHVHCLAVYDQETLIGFLPLVLRRWRGIRILQLIGSMHNESNSLLADPKCRLEVLDALGDFLGKNSGCWDILLTPRAVGPLAELGIGTTQLQQRVLGATPRLSLSLPSTWSHYWESLRQSQRKQFANRQRRIARVGSIDFRVYEGPDAIPRAVEELASLRLRSWRERGRYMDLWPMEKEPQFWDFLHAACTALAESGAVRLSRLTCDGRTMAMGLHFAQGPRLIKYMQAWDPAFEYYSPGLLEHLAMIRSAIDSGFATMDLGGGANLYKIRLGAERDELRDLIFAPRTLRGLFALTACVWTSRFSRGIAAVRAEPTPGAVGRRLLNSARRRRSRS